MSANTNAAASGVTSALQVMLEVEGLSAWYGAAQILFDLALQVGRG
jgi:branched-chain amino acid transport system ATP-binding protein